MLLELALLVEDFGLGDDLDGLRCDREVRELGLGGSVGGTETDAEVHVLVLTGEHSDLEFETAACGIELVDDALVREGRGADAHDLLLVIAVIEEEGFEGDLVKVEGDSVGAGDGSGRGEGTGC